MKMINAGTAPITEYSNFQYNCILNKCQQKYYVPVPTLAAVQLFVNFGPVKPFTVTWTQIEACAHNSTAELEVDCFKIAFNGTNWYGVFRGFSSASNFRLFSIALEVVYVNTTEATFFSEQYELPTAGCSPLTKISVCYPANYNADDINGIYVGAHDSSQSYSGSVGVFYQHQFWVRDVEVMEVQNQITFKANSTRNFATTLNKIFELRYELVPGWYKDYLLSVYFRGNFTINDTPTRASELSFENILEEADIWKAYVKIDKELKGAFGCAPIECVDDCICYPPTLPAFTLEILTGVPFIRTIPIGGSPTFNVTWETKPAWLNIYISGNDLILSGTPNTVDASVTFTISNACGSIDITKAISYTCNPPAFVGIPELPAALPGEPYNYVINLTGSPAFTLINIVKPSWMTITVVDSSIVLSGTPTESEDINVAFDVTNCSETVLNFDQTTSVFACGQFLISFLPPFPMETANYSFKNCKGGIVEGSLNNGTLNECMLMNGFNEPVYFITDSGYMTVEYIGPC